MKLKDLQILKTALEKISQKSSILVKFKIELFLSSIQNELAVYDKLFKECVTEDVSSFETKRLEILERKLTNVETNFLMEEIVENNKEEHSAYINAVKQIELLGNIDRNIDFILSFDDIPDDLEDLTPQESNVLFTITD
jgi:translation initiation factor 2 beta subunit (eIF-2beta)/eIF-5